MEKEKISYAHTGSEKSLLWVTMGDMLRDISAKYPENDALVVSYRNERYDYRRFYQVCRRATKGFMKLGIAKGDTVAIWATNYPEWVFTQFATGMIGAVLVPINPAFRSHELEYALKDSQSTTLILIERFKTSDYPLMFEQVCPELEAARPGEIKSAKLPYLKNVIFLGKGRNLIPMVRSF